MPDESAPRSPETPDRGRHPPSSGGVGSPLQTRAAFLQNWDWQSVTSINRGACERGRAQHGINSETHSACAEEWEAVRPKELTLLDTFELLRRFHRRAPFLFFNGNTFASIGRELAFALFSNLPAVRKREVSSAVAHYIAGVLDREAMIAVVEGLSANDNAFRPGHRVQTLRRSTGGVVVAVRDDGQIVWRPDGSRSELISLPEALRPLES
ncbi:MAG TPA: hypothetical protein PLX89_25270 [Verrucomicrobiota bacterium]|nr:hypothetical protein [Verrucomicrobiota bacterium]